MDGGVRNRNVSIAGSIHRIGVLILVLGLVLAVAVGYALFATAPLWWLYPFVVFGVFVIGGQILIALAELISAQEAIYQRLKAMEQGSKPAALG